MKIYLIAFVILLNSIGCWSNNDKSNDESILEMTKLKEKIIISIKDSTTQIKEVSKIMNLKLVKTYKTSDLIQALESKKIYENVEPSKLISAKLKIAKKISELKKLNKTETFFKEYNFEYKNLSYLTFVNTKPKDSVVFTNDKIEFEESMKAINSDRGMLLIYLKGE